MRKEKDVRGEDTGRAQAFWGQGAGDGTDTAEGRRGKSGQQEDEPDLKHLYFEMLAPDMLQ